MTWPRIDADALRVVREVPEARCDRRASGCDLWRPAEHPGDPPAWLLPHQHAPWRRTVAALRLYGAAMIAEPVGSGKTWMALAVARTLGSRVTVVVPGIVLPQWRAAATQVLPQAHWHTLERCSRGVPPPHDDALAIVDEAHRLRHLGSRRVATLASWLARRKVIFLTATPIVNRSDDLLAILRLAVPDHVLVLDGIASLPALAPEAYPPPALRRLVIRTAGGRTEVPVERRVLSPDAAEHRRARRAATCIRRLRLAHGGPVRRLLLGVFADAAASSDAAWFAALKRYRGLLVHAQEAGGVSRTMLRRFAGAEGEQGVFWSLLEPARQHDPPHLPIEDLPAVERALALPNTDGPWLGGVARDLGDGRITVVFCRHRATARAVRCCLGDDTAWVTGVSAGIGPHSLPRASVLAAFGPTRAAWQLRRVPPQILVATDVASEGLDLQAAERVVHLDLPWTATRRDQRDGRVRRIGQVAKRVEVVERHPAPALESLLHLALRVRRKDAIATRWLTALEGCQTSAATIPSPPAPHPVLIVELHAGDRSGVVAVGIEGGAARVLSPADAAALAAVAIGIEPPTDAAAIRLARAAALRSAAPPAPHRALLARIHRLARGAARRRDPQTLLRLDRLLRHATQRGPVGLERELDAIAHLPDAALCLHDLPTVPDARTPTATVVGVLVPRPPLPLR